MAPFEIIRVVRGDEGIAVDLHFTRANGAGLDLSSPTTEVVVRFAPAHSESTLALLTITKVNGGQNGECVATFPPGALDVPSGFYHAEIELRIAGEPQTAFDPLRFFVRERFQ